MICEFTVCPVCQSDLHYGDDDVSCSNCSRKYSRRDGILDFTPIPPPDQDVADKWLLWEHLQENGRVAYEADPTHNLSVGHREDAEAYKDFCELTGLVLDVGCGPQEIPSYGIDDIDQFLGIDPLLGVQPRLFEFFLGIGEYLPFRTATFDCVLFATSLDHMLNPKRALAEACRVVKDDGTVNLWFFEPDQNAEVSPEWIRLKEKLQKGIGLIKDGNFSEFALRILSLVNDKKELTNSSIAQAIDEPSYYLSQLEVPNGAVDYFHYFHLAQTQVLQWLERTGLFPVKQIVFNQDHHFIQAKRR